MRAPLLAAVVVALLAVPASAANAPAPLTGDLDGDGTEETVTSQQGSVCPDGSSGAFCRQEASVTISGTCPDGSKLERKVATTGGSNPQVASVQLVDADGLPGSEVFVDLRPQPSVGARENTRLVAWRGRQGACAEPKTLWSWPGPTGPPPYRGARYAGFEAGFAEITKSFPGLEIALFEYFAARGKPRTKPTLLRRTLFRYSDKRGAYERYFRNVVHIRPR